MTRFHRTRAFAFCAALPLAAWLLAGTPVSAENPDHVRQAQQSHSCPGCDLSGANLAGRSFELGDLTGANLSEAILYRANLRASVLTGATLTGADLKGADLRNATGADLGGAVTDASTTCPDGKRGPC